MQKSSIRVLGEEAAAAGGASISFQGKNVTRLPEGQHTWSKLLQIDKTFLTLWCYFCFACNAYCPSAHPAAAACLASCPLFQWPCPFIILSLFVPPPLHPAPILTVGIKAHHFGLVWCYTEDKKHIVRFFVEMFQSCLITLLQTNSATFLIPAMTGCFIQDSFFNAPTPKKISTALPLISLENTLSKILEALRFPSFLKTCTCWLKMKRVKRAQHYITLKISHDPK